MLPGLQTIGRRPGKPESRDLGDTKGALESYGKAKTILEAVLNAQPRHRVALLEMGSLHILIGAQLLHVGQPAASLESKRKALAYWQRLAGAAPGDEPARRGLAAAYSEMATATDDYLALEGRLSYGNKARAIYRELLDASPSDPERMRDLARTHKYLSGMYQTDADRFLEHARAAAELDGERVAIAPQNAAAQIELAQSLSMVATGWGKKGDFSTAASVAERSVAIRRTLWEADQKDHRVRDRLAYALTQLGHYRAKQRDWPGALECFCEAIAHAEPLARDTDSHSAWDTLAWAHLERSDAYGQIGSGDVCAEYRQAAEAYRRLMAYRREHYGRKLSEVQRQLAVCGGS